MNWKSWKHLTQAILLGKDGAQNHLVFQQMYTYFNRVSNVGSGNYIYSWKSKGLSAENYYQWSQNQSRIKLFWY